MRLSEISQSISPVFLDFLAHNKRKRYLKYEKCHRDETVGHFPQLRDFGVSLTATQSRLERGSSTNYRELAENELTGMKILTIRINYLFINARNKPPAFNDTMFKLLFELRLSINTLQTIKK